MDLEALFARIGYTDGGTDTERLRRLHRAYVTHVPYENLDVFNDRDLSLEPEDLFDKIVNRRRGGYCFEMNGFFCAVLRELGFPAYGVLARLSRDGKTFGGYVHRMNVTEADGVRYLCDVGFGREGFPEPLRLELDTLQERHGLTYRIVRGVDPGMEYTVELLQDGTFQPRMGFIDRPAQQEDFVICSYYMNRSPSSPFRKMLMLNRFTETGRYSLMNLRLTYLEGEKAEVRELAWEELPQVLQTCFGLEVMPDRMPEPLPT